MRSLKEPECKVCGHPTYRHEIEPPYPCYDCNCPAFSYVIKEEDYAPKP